MQILLQKTFSLIFKKIETVQYKVTFVIIGTMKETLHDRLYQELGLESLADRRWSRKLSFLHKITQGLLPYQLKNFPECS